MSNHDLIQLIDGIRIFPIGEIAADRQTLLCKAKIISFLAPYQEQFDNYFEKNNIEDVVEKFLGAAISLKEGEFIPDVASAERFLKLPPGLLCDYSILKIIPLSYLLVKCIFETEN